MKRILLSIFIFIVLLFLVDRAFYYCFTKYIFNHTLTGEEGAGDVNYFLQNGAQYKCIVLGSSRAKHHINVAKLTAIPGKTCNEGINGIGGVKYNDIFADLLFSKHIYPTYIILQTDVIWLTQTDNFPDEEIRLFYPFIKQSLVLDDYIRQLPYQERLKLFLFRSYRYNGRFLNILYNSRKQNPMKENGGFDPLHSVLDSATASYYLLRKNIADSDKAFVPEMGDALKSIINNCRAHNVKLFIVLPPYFNNATYDPFLLKKFYNSFGNADIIDMSDIRKFPDLQSRLNWCDYSHMNEVGANKFSSYLNDSLVMRLKNKM